MVCGNDDKYDDDDDDDDDDDVCYNVDDDDADDDDDVDEGTFSLAMMKRYLYLAKGRDLNGVDVGRDQECR